MNKKFIVFVSFVVAINFYLYAGSNDIPLPEHPRPDFYRADWINLNGDWDFQFDESDEGIGKNWAGGKVEFDRTIRVPFSWGAPLSGVEDKADIAWYKKEISIPENWKNKKVFVVLGACDWKTSAWIDGHFLGDHQGGYTPFEYDLSPFVGSGGKHIFTLRVDDTDLPFKLEGKQGYGKARGIWQTVYLEARGNPFIEYVHVTPDIDNSRIRIEGRINQAVKSPVDIRFSIDNKDIPVQREQLTLKEKETSFSLVVPLNHVHLWNLEDPFLYDLQVTLVNENNFSDEINTYFGMRKVSVVNLPGTDIPYVALNNKPVYLQLTLDQAYHPGGYYTFPSDTFIRDEIMRSKRIGLNGQRVHVKVGIPRKLYWADRLGLLIMADVPNSWGEPGEEMRAESAYAMRNMIRRDFNHPSVFMWVLFNETWGLFSNTGNGQRQYLDETQQWVAAMYREAKTLDPTRLVEDNSACNYDHVETDINSWHAYLPGYKWGGRLDEISEKTYPGSPWNFTGGHQQAVQPNINSECGNVWGYEGSTGDVDWSWDYHIMINEFRKHPKIAGWLYTEHHDVINEWNGYYRFDRTTKDSGLEAFGMDLNDLHKAIQITPDIDLAVEANVGESLDVPLWMSVFTDELPASDAVVSYFLTWTDDLGNSYRGELSHVPTRLEPWKAARINPVRIVLPGKPCLAVLHLILETSGGMEISRNFTTFRVKRNGSGTMSDTRVITFDPASYKSSRWTFGQSEVLDGLKVNGFGSGYFEYEISIPDDVRTDGITSILFKAELSSRERFGRDVDEIDKMSGDYMRGNGTHDPAVNPNAYPMTDENKHEGLVRIYVNGRIIKEAVLPDDPADHRGILSWMSQPLDGKLREAGSYGYLVEAGIPEGMIPDLLKRKTLRLRLEVQDSLAGGLSVYGKDFGRYPVEPCFILIGGNNR